MYRNLHQFLHAAEHNCISKRKDGAVLVQLMFCHCYSRNSQEEVLPFKWYVKAYPTLTKLTHQLQNVDLIDGRLVNVNDGSIIIDERITHKMHTLKSLVRVFIGSPVVQRHLRERFKDFSVNGKYYPVAVFSEPSEREPMIVNSLTKVSSFLNVSAQQRKVVRHTICPQITQHRIWTGALEELVNGLKSEMDSLSNEYSGKGSNMEQQIISSCLKFLDNSQSTDHECTSWMHIKTPKSVDSLGSATWGDLLEMFNDLIRCLKSEKGLVYHVAKLEVMKEGLFQIKDVLVDKGIGYKEVRHQESLVQKKLSKTLGHSSCCLFTILLYYLYGYARDFEVDLCGGIDRGDGGTGLCLYMGRILTSDDDKMVRSGVKQLDRVLRLFKFVWETAGMKGVLELQGHLWCVGAKDRMLTYRGTSFFVHGVSL